ncbi:fatty acid--CoA ligase [Paraburkholderia sediminicola]|uniref:fatty acid--CoA ligase n=1 Tax=Paraburkholderia sediminicola TaxID=458836 RepID=UPI0038BB258E
MEQPEMAEQPTSAYAYPLLIRQLLTASYARYSSAEVVYRDSRFTYAQLFERVCRLAGGLRGLGVEVGDTVAIMDWDSHRYLECYFAIPMMGAVLMTANVRLSAEQIAYTLNASGAKVLIVNAEFESLFESVRDRLTNIREVVHVEDNEVLGEHAPKGAIGYEALLARAPASFDFPELDENARATTFFTTGTTGNPKGVYFTHRQIVLHTLSTAAAFCSAARQGRMDRDDVYMPMTPMFHVHAWGIPYIATFLGMKQVYPGKYSPENLLNLIGRERVTFTHCVATILNMLLNHESARAVDFSAMKIIVGGGPLPRGLVETALTRGIDVYGAYGMSETGPFLTLSQIETTDLDGSSREVELRTRTGRPMPLVDLRVVNDRLSDMPPDGDTIGEVVIRAPWLTQGYLNDSQSSAALWQGGYLHTNDLGVMHPDGYVQLKDRSKDIIKTGGEWVSSLALEDLISCHEAVHEVAVIAVAHAVWGERPVALVVLKPGAQADEAALKEHLGQYVQEGQLARMAIPDRILAVPSLDRTSVGKFDKKLLREKYRLAL